MDLPADAEGQRPRLTSDHSRLTIAAVIPTICRFLAGVSFAVAGALVADGRLDAQTAPPPQPRAVDVSKLAGPKTVVSATAVRRIPADAAKMTIRPDEYVIARWTAKDLPTTPVQATSNQAVAAGYGFIAITRDGREVRFRPIIETSGNLQVTPDGTFEGRIFVGLQDLRDPAAAYELPNAVALLVSGQVDSVAPRQLSLTHTNLPFEEITIGARDPSDELELQLLATGTTERATARLKVARPRLEIVPSRRRIQGFGFERMDVTVRAVGIQRSAERVVSLVSEPGSFESAQVSLNEQGTAVARLRSVSVGTATVQASSPPLTAASAEVQFVWPVATLIASILGGMVGAFIKRMQGGRIRSSRAFRSVLLVGVLSGIVVVALYAVGVNVLPVQPTATAGEVLTFAMAAVGGYLGLQLPKPAAR